MNLEKAFKVKKPVIGMLHLDYLKGQPEYRGWNYLMSKAMVDFYNLQDGGINGILIENWKEDTIGEKANPKNADCMRRVCKRLPPAEVPLGLNVLNNDYQASFDIAKEIGAKFVQLDTFIDNVKTEFDFSPSAKEHPFEIKPNPREIIEYRESIGAEDVALFTSIQPKHYKMLERKSIKTSTEQAIENGSDAIIVTGTKTGFVPDLRRIAKVRKAVKDMKSLIPIGLGSGFNKYTAELFFPKVDFVITGTGLKYFDLNYRSNTDNPVDIEKVRELMGIVRELDKKR
jgi:membrane complex biogenesis BtpA family protein